jgi:hypothetical protein
MSIQDLGSVGELVAALATMATLIYLAGYAALGRAMP